MIVGVHLHEYSLPHGMGNARFCRFGCTRFLASSWPLQAMDSPADACLPWLGVVRLGMPDRAGGRPGQPGGGGTMRKVPLAGAAAALVLGVASAVAIPIVSRAAGPSPAKSKTLVFNVAFSPPEFVQANNVRNPHSQFSLGDEIVFHDQLFAGSQHVGDEAGSCVLVDVSQAPLANCTMVVRLPGGTSTGQF